MGKNSLTSIKTIGGNRGVSVVMWARPQLWELNKNFLVWKSFIWSNVNNHNSPNELISSLNQQ